MLEQKLHTPVSCPGIEVPWKMWGETDSWFPIQSRKNSADFFQASQKIKISIFYRFLLSKRYIGSTKNCNRSFILCKFETWFFVCNKFCCFVPSHHVSFITELFTHWVHCFGRCKHNHTMINWCYVIGWWITAWWRISICVVVK